MPLPRHVSRPASRRCLVPVIAGLTVLGACASDAPTVLATSTTLPSTTVPSTTSAGPATTPAPPPTSAGSTSDPAPTSAAGTAGPARARVEWLLGLINSQNGDPAEVEAGFAPSFLEQVSVSELVAAVGGVVARDSNWRVVDDRELTALQGSVVIAGDLGRRTTVSIAVEPDGEHRVSGLQLQPLIDDPFPTGTPVTPAAFDAALAGFGPSTGFGLYDVTAGDCRLVHGVAPDTARPIGSAFKLWILAALATEIEAGRAAWDETMPVTDSLKSSTDGEIAPLAAGTPVTLRRYAELMVSISDNSATDHLLHRLGRLTVEQAMRDAGVARPELDIPIYGTREMFLLKWGRTLPAADYLALDTEGRRAALDGLAGVTLAADLDPALDPSVPRLLDRIEWFASPADECRTQLRLADLATRPGLEPVADILRINPGVPFGEEWTDVRFKGGSEVGLVFVSWRLERRDGRVYVLAGGAMDPSRPLDDLAVVNVLAAGVRLTS